MISKSGITVGRAIILEFEVRVPVNLNLNEAHTVIGARARFYQIIKGHASDRMLKMVVPLVGFELTTYRLQGGCSTN